MKRRHALIAASDPSEGEGESFRTSAAKRARRLDSRAEDGDGGEDEMLAISPATDSSSSLELALPRLRSLLQPLSLIGVHPLLELAAFMPAAAPQTTSKTTASHHALAGHHQQRHTQQSPSFPRVLPMQAWLVTARLILHKGGGTTSHHHHQDKKPTTAQLPGAPGTPPPITLIAALAISVLDVSSRFIFKTMIVPVPIRPLLILLADLGGEVGTDLGSSVRDPGRSSAAASSAGGAGISRNQSVTMTSSGSSASSSSPSPSPSSPSSPASPAVPSEWASSCIRAFVAAVLLKDRSSFSTLPPHLLRFDDAATVNVVAGELIQTFAASSSASSSSASSSLASGAASSGSTAAASAATSMSSAAAGGGGGAASGTASTTTTATPPSYAAAALASLNQAAREEAAKALLTFLDKAKETALAAARDSLSSFYRSVSSLSADAASLPTHPLQVLTDDDLLSAGQSGLSSADGNSSLSLARNLARDLWGNFVDRLGPDIVSSLAAVSAESSSSLTSTFAAAAAAATASSSSAAAATASAPPLLQGFPASSLAPTPTPPTLGRDISVTGEILGPRFLGLKLEELPSSGGQTSNTALASAGGGLSLMSATAASASSIGGTPAPFAPLLATGAVAFAFPVGGSLRPPALPPPPSPLIPFLIPPKSVDSFSSGWNVTAVRQTTLGGPLSSPLLATAALLEAPRIRLLNYLQQRRQEQPSALALGLASTGSASFPFPFFLSAPPSSVASLSAAAGAPAASPWGFSLPAARQ